MILWEHVGELVLPNPRAKLRKVSRSTGPAIGGGHAGSTASSSSTPTAGGLPRRRCVQRQGSVEGSLLRRARARYVAKMLPAGGPLRAADAIGVAHPVDVMVETFGPRRIERARIAELVDTHFDLGSARSSAYRPIYQKTAAYGHFGRDSYVSTWGVHGQGRAPRRPGPSLLRRPDRLTMISRPRVVDAREAELRVRGVRAAVSKSTTPTRALDGPTDRCSRSAGAEARRAWCAGHRAGSRAARW